MKKLLILGYAFIIATLSYGQSETLFSNFSISGFGGPIFSVSEINGETAFAAGGGGGVIIGDFFIGGFGEGIDISNTTLRNDIYDVDLGYGGLWLGYSLLGRKAIHPFVGLKLASGEVNIDIDSGTITSNNVQVLIPEAGVEFNFTQWMRLVTHVGYRKVGNLGDNNLISAGQLSGLTGGITLRFGFFR